MAASALPPASTGGGADADPAPITPAAPAAAAAAAAVKPKPKPLPPKAPRDAVVPPPPSLSAPGSGAAGMARNTGSLSPLRRTPAGGATSTATDAAPEPPMGAGAASLRATDGRKRSVLAPGQQVTRMCQLRALFDAYAVRPRAGTEADKASEMAAANGRKRNGSAVLSRWGRTGSAKNLLAGGGDGSDGKTASGSSKPPAVTCARLLRLAEDCKLLAPGKLSASQVTLIFAAVKLGRRETISLDRFEEALRRFAVQRDEPFSALVAAAMNAIESRPAAPPPKLRQKSSKSQIKEAAARSKAEAAEAAAAAAAAAAATAGGGGGGGGAASPSSGRSDPSGGGSGRESMGEMEIAADVLPAWNQMKLRRRHRFLVFKIDNEANLISLDAQHSTSRGRRASLGLIASPGGGKVGGGKSAAADAADAAAAAAADAPVFDQLMALLPFADCRFALYDHEYTSPDGRPQSKIWFVSWFPHNASHTAKMAYTYHKKTLRAQLEGVQDCTAASRAALEESVGLRVLQGHGSTDDDDDEYTSDD